MQGLKLIGFHCCRDIFTKRSCARLHACVRVCVRVCVCVWVCVCVGVCDTIIMSVTICNAGITDITKKTLVSYCIGFLILNCN